MATVSTLTTYGSMDVAQVRLHAEPTQDNHAATRLYVDTAAATVRAGILDGAGPALDTLKEIETFLQGDSSNVSAGLVNQLSSIQAQVTAEVSRASGAEGVLHSDIMNEQAVRHAAVTSVGTALSFETAERIQGQVDLNDRANYLENRANTLSQQHHDDDLRLSAEIAARTTAESALQSQLATSVTEVNTRADGLLATKLDKTGGAVSGDLAVSGMVSIGPAWRIVAVGASLEFQYSPDQGESWSTGIPFISV